MTLVRAKISHCTVCEEQMVIVDGALRMQPLQTWMLLDADDDEKRRAVLHHRDCPEVPPRTMLQESTFDELLRDTRKDG